MARPITVRAGVCVPARAIRTKAVRSGGPGGQNVNKVSSKVELRIELERIEGLDEEALARLKRAIRHRLDADGLWIVVSSLTRDRLKNLEDAEGKVVRTIEKALECPELRTPTRPTRASRERRVDAKKRTSEIKRGRSGSDWD